MNKVAVTKQRILDRQFTTRQLLFILFSFLCLVPWITPPMAFFLGLVVVQLIGHPFLHLNQKATSILMQVSVIGLGFGMHITSAFSAGKTGMLLIIFTVIGTLTLGRLIGNALKIEKKTAYLVSCGTAICGGSAIAAISPILNVKEGQTSVALATIFILNAIALFLFPWIGHALCLNETQFGLWCAIAIHDTSSVVGAASKFGPHALEVATAVKLTRALWILPLSLANSFLNKNHAGKIKIPYFIALFVIAITLNTYIPGVLVIAPVLVTAAKAGLTLTLFLVGSGLSKQVLKSVDTKPLLQGSILWIIVSAATLWLITTVV